MGSTGVANDAECLPTERLEAEITRLAGHLAAAECRWLLLVAEFDRREAWRAWGCSGVVHWLGWHCGLDARSAREKVRVARSLRECSAIRDAFAAGQLSYSKVRAITRIATPANEAVLARMARHATASEIERIVAGYRRTFDPERRADEDRVHEQRAVHWLTDDDAWVSKARLPVGDGAIVRGVVEALTERSIRLRPLTAGETRAQRRADALVEMALLAARAIEEGDDAPLPDADRYLAVVNVDRGVLAEDEGERCELDGGPGLPAETARRLTCDAYLVGLVRGARSAVVDVGHRTRVVPRWLRRQLHARDGGCRFPGCGERRHVTGHHVTHWARGGATSLSNLIELCRYHHRLVHEGGWNVQLLADGTADFACPSGSAEPPTTTDTAAGSAEPPDHVELEVTIESCNRQQGISVDDRTIVADWYGDRLDLDLVLTALDPDNLARRQPGERFRGTAA